jgi:hypothetical protein
LEQEINDLKNENREGLEITLEASRNWYQRLLGLLEGRLENLKRQLCQAAGCNQYPNCPHGQ